MITKEQLLAVSGLELTGKIEEMNDIQLSEFVQELNEFIDNFPIHKENLKNAIAAREYGTFVKCLTGIGEVLAKINAGKLAAECQRQIDQLNDMGHERDHAKIEEDMTEFLMSVSMLSLDIQMADRSGNEDQQAKTENPAPEAGVEPKSESEHNKILAVDDAAFFLNTIKAYLQDTPYKLTCVNSGQAAMSYLSNNRPSLFMLDIDMPEMNGYELARKIRERGHNAPIIFLTSSADRNAVINAVNSGGTDFLIKPASKDMLINRIRKYI